ncbi:MAG: polysaccharide biosynthesis protein [Saprospiraceae bacterium]|nr:polysaccharide biosynthesis protein [Saprospiraceae bacterium]
MSLIKQLAGQTVVYGISTVLPRVLHFLVFTVYLTNRVFATEENSFGIYSDLYAYAAILLVLLVYRLDTAYFRFGKKAEGEKIIFSSASVSLFTSTTVAFLLLITCRSHIAEWLKYPGQERYVIYFAGILALDALAALPLARLRLADKAKHFALIKILGVLVNLSLVLLFLEVLPTVKPQVLQGTFWLDEAQKLDLLFLSNLIASAVVLCCLLPQYRYVRVRLFSTAAWRRMMLYLLPLVIVGMAGVFNQSFAVPLIKYLLPGTDTEVQMGLYSAVAKLAIFMNLFTVAFNYAAEPFFFKQSSHKHAQDTYAQVAKAFAMGASILLLALLLNLNVLQYLIGERYRVALHLVPILLVAFWFLGLYYNVSVWYKITDRTGWGALFSLVGVGVTIAITVFFIDDLGTEALAWAALGCYAIMNVLAYLIGRHYYPVDYPVVRILSYLFGALGFYFFYLVFRQDRLIIDLILGTLLLLIFIYVLYKIEIKDVRQWLGTTRADQK